MKCQTTILTKKRKEKRNIPTILYNRYVINYYEKIAKIGYKAIQGNKNFMNTKKLIFKKKWTGRSKKDSITK